ncbi:unnamed protein product, partial [Protopolystoma xenopodis]
MGVPGSPSPSVARFYASSPRDVGETIVNQGLLTSPRKHDAPMPNAAGLLEDSLCSLQVSLSPSLVSANGAAVLSNGEITLLNGRRLVEYSGRTGTLPTGSLASQTLISSGSSSSSAGVAGAVWPAGGCSLAQCQLSHRAHPRQHQHRHHPLLEPHNQHQHLHLQQHQQQQQQQHSDKVSSPRGLVTSPKLSDRCGISVPTFSLMMTNGAS